MKNNHNPTPLVIGVAGMPGAGKTSFYNYLTEAVTGAVKNPALAGAQMTEVTTNGFRICTRRFSDPVRERMEKEGLEPSRKKLQKYVQDMEVNAIAEGRGRGELSRLMEDYVHNKMIDENTHPSFILVLDGVRWPADEAMMRRIPNSMLVGITKNQRKRYEDIIAGGRDDNAREQEKTFEEFVAEDGAENERYTPTIIENADIAISNNGTAQEFRNIINYYWHNHIKQRV